MRSIAWMCVSASLARCIHLWSSSVETLPEVVSQVSLPSQARRKIDPFDAISGLFLALSPNSVRFRQREFSCASACTLPIVLKSRHLSRHNIPLSSDESVQLESRSSHSSQDVATSEKVLAEFDRNYQNVAASKGSVGLGGGKTANEWAVQADYDTLADAVRVLCQEALQRNGSFRMGICADDASTGVAGLKQWVSALALPRGTLHGMDVNGVPKDMSSFGPVYIKYNSLATENNPPGTANVNGYGGDFRGVYLNFDNKDDVVRVYGVLPLGIFDSARSRHDIETPVTQTSEAGSRVGAVQKSLAKIVPALVEHQAKVTVEEAFVDKDTIVLRYEGPPKFKRSIELLLNSDFPDLKRVSFMDESSAD